MGTHYPHGGPRKWALTPSSLRRLFLFLVCGWYQAGSGKPGGLIWPGWVGPWACHGGSSPTSGLGITSGAPEASSAVRAGTEDIGCRRRREAGSEPIPFPGLKPG